MANSVGGNKDSRWLLKLIIFVRDGGQKLIGH